MGVPGLFSWLKKRWPLAVQKVKPYDLVDEAEVAPVDNLYLDLNGLIHPSVAEGNSAHGLDYAKFEDHFFNYMDQIIETAQPRKLVYLAVDGIAPAAKLAQQRQRRFRSATERHDCANQENILRKEMTQKGLCAPRETAGQFDTNAITPRTDFMLRVAQSLRRYVADRVQSSGLVMILSDDGVPGEGEHKAMQFIRAQRAQPGYDPTTHHCMVGSDADLILLGLATHEIEFSILREDKWIRLWIVRDYLEFEFAELKAQGKLSFEFDIERLINDFVLVCSLIGNDFLPHLPALDVHEGAIDLLLAIYKEQLPLCADYMVTTAGDVVSSYFSLVLQRVAGLESKLFVHHYLTNQCAKKKGSFGAKSTGPCFDFAQGKCRRGINCKFAHGESTQDPAAGEAGAGAEGVDPVEEQLTQLLLSGGPCVAVGFTKATKPRGLHVVARKLKLQSVDDQGTGIGCCFKAVVWNPAAVAGLLSDRVLPDAAYTLTADQQAEAELAPHQVNSWTLTTENLVPEEAVPAASMLQRVIQLDFERRLSQVTLG